MAHLDAVYRPVFSQAEYQAGGSGNGVADLHLPSPMQNAKGYVVMWIHSRQVVPKLMDVPDVEKTDLGAKRAEAAAILVFFCLILH